MIDDMRHLVVFAKVAEALSISAAAEQLGIASATASAHVAKLEASLGFPLFYRNTRRLSLTHQGTELLNTAQSIMALYESEVLSLRKPSLSLKGSVRIAAPAVLVNCTPFIEALTGLLADHPGLHADLRFSDLRADLIGDGVDVAFRIGDLADSSLRSRPLFRLPRVVVGSQKLLEEHGPLSHPSQLASLPWIGLSMRRHHRTFMNPAGERVEIRYAPRIVSNSVEAALRMSEHGLGLAAPPRSLFEKGCLAQEVLPSWSIPPLDVHAVWPANAAANSIGYRLTQRLAEVLATAPV